MAWAWAVGKFFKGMPEMMAATIPHFFSASKVPKWVASPSRICTLGKLAVMYWQSSGSSSTQTSRSDDSPLANNIRVMHPVPGPISTTNSSVFWIASSAAFVMQSARYLELGAIVPTRAGAASILFKSTLVSSHLWKKWLPARHSKSNTNAVRFERIDKGRVDLVKGIDGDDLLSHLLRQYHRRCWA